MDRCMFFRRIPALIVILSVIMSNKLWADNDVHIKHAKHHNSVVLNLPITTQGPLWPPSAISDENGNFILVGSSLEKTDSGGVELKPGRQLIISKDTIPPLDQNGKETFINPFAAPYDIVRELDLSKGSPDLDLILYSNSFGPPEGNFGGGPRVPAITDSPYNLNSFPLEGQPCPDVFPAESQRFTYLKPSYPLHQVPISGYQGDHIAYDPNTGDSFIPNKKTGINCPAVGCEGENSVDSRRTKPITLREWLKASVKVRIKLTNYDVAVNGFTAAKFSVRAKNLLPNSIYHVYAIRTNLLVPNPIPSVSDPLGMPSIFVTDKRGRGRLDVTVDNPFPSSEEDGSGLRIIGMSVAFRSSFQSNGACVTPFGPGVDVHAVASSFADGTLDFTDFTTKEAP